MAGGGGNEPNLTPLIDLFSVLIVFLLMTASWLQLESLQVQVEQKAPPSTTDNPPPVTPPQEEDKEKKVKLNLRLFADRVVAHEDEKETVYQATHEKPGDASLMSLLKDWKSRFPKNNNIIINTDSSASYGQLIRLYDFVVSSGWSEIGINPY